MRFLLTSTGITNTSIHHALVELLGKPIAESSARCMPTATHALPGGAPGMAVHQRTSPHTDVRAGLEVLGRAGADRDAQH